MKNIQIIDGSQNALFEIYSIPDELFARLFPNGADVAFMSDFVDASKDDEETQDEWKDLYRRPVDKKTVKGIDGTLHLVTTPCEKKFFPNRKEDDVLNPSVKVEF